MELPPFFSTGPVNLSMTRKFRQGEEKALQYLYKTCRKSLIEYGGNLIHDEETVSNLLNECFLKAWTHRSRMTSLAHIYRFIRLNLRWQCLKVTRNASYLFHKNMLPLEAAITHRNQLPEHYTPSDESPDLLRLRTAYQLVGFLPDIRKRILTLHYQDGLEITEIAQRFGLSKRKALKELTKGVDEVKRMANPTAHVKYRGKYLRLQMTNK